MAEKNFFDLLKEKMAALRASEKHRDDDWTALNDRLNMALPEQPPKRRVVRVLPLLLLAALLSSNAAWWQTHRNDRAVLHRLEKQVVGLQTSVAALEAAAPVIRTDTVWRMVYEQSNRDMSFMHSLPKPFTSQHTRRLSLNDSGPDSANDMLPISKTERNLSVPVTAEIDNLANIAPTTLEPAMRTAVVPFLKTPKLASLKVSKSKLYPIKYLVVNTLKNKEPTEPIGKNLFDALRPKYFKVGANFGWFYAKSSGLMHEGGFSYGFGGLIGLSRHWSLTADYREGQLHYKAHDPGAILGAPLLPAPGYGHHLTEMEVTGQKVRQFNVGLRYTLTPPGKPHPFLGLGWGGLTVLPYTVEYETQHEPTGAIHKNAFSISEHARLRNILRFGAGLEIPLSPRFDLTLEGSYLRQWKKPVGIAPDLIDIRGGLYWLF